jgi:hypothetical protein
MQPNELDGAQHLRTNSAIEAEVAQESGQSLSSPSGELSQSAQQLLNRLWEPA